MLVLIDESGDPGFKISRGSSPHFIIAAVIFDEELDAEKAAVELKLLRRELGLPDHYEFHFNGSSEAIKAAFLKRAAANNFRVRLIVFDKSVIYSEELRTTQSSFYNYAIKCLLKDAQANIRDATIKLDGRGDRGYKKAAETYLRQQLNQKDNRVLKKFKYVDSKKDILIQLADMVSGAVYRSLQKDRHDSGKYKRLISKRIENIWRFK